MGGGRVKGERQRVSTASVVRQDSRETRRGIIYFTRGIPGPSITIMWCPLTRVLSLSSMTGAARVLIFLWCNNKLRTFSSNNHFCVHNSKNTDFYEVWFVRRGARLDHNGTDSHILSHQMYVEGEKEGEFNNNNSWTRNIYIPTL